MIRHTMMAVSLGIILFFLYLMHYTGAFKGVTVALDERGPYTLIYKEHTGPYHKIVQHIQEVEKWARENRLKCRLSFGQYFDDPRIVEEGRLTSRGGCLLDPLVEDEQKIFETLKDRLPPEFKTEVLAKDKSIVAIFDGAASIGPIKVYPRMEEFARDQQLKIKRGLIEIYEIFDEKSMRTTYIWPVQNEQP